ncbi:hypothetical protein Golob_024121 [Gossypium lobatum]|uniref:Programmed cell death protein 4 n=2 Tax=Gossypium TaxID=3633 RepID=A0A7J8NGK0_9ROSI|nr:hypothetical protein [Gossypium lobatum]
MIESDIITILSVHGSMNHNITHSHPRPHSAEKMKHSGKNSEGNGKPSDVRKDRKSGRGMNGSPKKGGHGGKFTWVGDGLSPAEIGVETELVDVKDPNFEDPDEILAD